MEGWPCAACSETNTPGTRFCGYCGAPRARGETSPSDNAGHAGLAAAPGDERRLITALFADISGYTTLADQLDPDLLVEIVDPVLRRMAAVIQRYEGRVVKFAGDAVLAFFGAPVAHEDDALRAVLCARDLRQEVAALVPSLPAPGRQIQLHIGVNTGHGVAGVRGGDLDYSVLGDAVNVAQRLESAAAAGEILVGERTRRLIGDALRFERVGPLSLKGKAEPVPAWRLVDALDGAESAVPSSRVPALIGRREQQAVLADAINAVARGRSCVLALVGEPGVGKTRLLQHAAAVAGDLGVGWLAARCLSYGAGLPYWPYTELLRHLAELTPTMSGREVFDGLRTLTARAGAPHALPYLREVLGVEPVGTGDDVPAHIRRSPSALRRSIHEAIRSVLAGTARRTPLVVAVEDIHWIDEASLELTRLLIDACADLPLGVVVTARPEASEMASGLDPLGGANVLTLQRLGRNDVADLAEQFLDGPIDGLLLDLLESRADGNPLFVREILRNLSETGDLQRTALGWSLGARGTGDVPTTVEAVLSARIDRLPSAAADALQTAALIGREVNLELLPALLADTPVPLETSLKTLVDHGFLTDDQSAGIRTVQFTHALVVDVAYGRLVRRRRQRMHRDVVRAAVQLYGDTDEVIDLLAHHAYRGAMGAAGLPLVRRAARRAAAIYANAEAIDNLRHALEMCDGSESLGEAADILVELGRLLTHVGAYEQAIDVYREAQERGAGLDAWLERADAAGKLHGGQAALSVLDEVSRHFPGATEAELARIDADRGRYLVLTGKPEQGVAMLEHAVATLRTTDPLPAALAQLALVTALGALGHDAAAVEQATEAVAVLERHGDAAQLTSALRVAGGAFSDLDRRDDAIAMLSRALEVARQTGDAEEEGAVLVNLGVAYNSWDEPGKAIEYLSQALPAFERIGIKNGIACVYCNLAESLAELGRMDESLAAAQAGLAVAEDTGSATWMTGALNGIARACCWQQQWSDASAAARRCIEVSEQAGLPNRLDYARRYLHAAEHHLRVAPTIEEFRALGHAEDR